MDGNVRDTIGIYPSDQRIITLDKGNGNLFKCKEEAKELLSSEREERLMRRRIVS